MPPAKLGSEKANRVINRIDGPKPSRLAVTEIRNQFDEKPTEDAEPATSVPDERGTETAAGPSKERVALS